MVEEDGKSGDRLMGYTIFCDDLRWIILELRKWIYGSVLHVDLFKTASVGVKGGSEDPLSSPFSTKLNKYALACAHLDSTNSIHLVYGSFASGKTSNSIGRRYPIVATFLVGAHGLAPSFAYLMAGRVIVGIGVAYSVMIAPVYTAEVSPAICRGFLTLLPEMFITFSILLCHIFNYALSRLPDQTSWRLMLGLAAVPTVMIALGVIFMPESHRWLVMKMGHEGYRWNKNYFLLMWL